MTSAEFTGLGTGGYYVAGLPTRKGDRSVRPKTRVMHLYSCLLQQMWLLSQHQCT